MPNRILKESICVSDTIDRLSLNAEIFFYRLIVQCDDYGRLDARPAILRTKCFPLRLDIISEIDIVDWIKELCESGLTYVYEADGKYYIQVTKWEKHQQIRAKKSKYPEPANNCNQLISYEIMGIQVPVEANQPQIQAIGNHVQSSEIICPRNPIQSNPIQSPKEKEIKFILPDWIPEPIWKEFVSMRIRIKHPLTEYAKVLAVKDLERLKNSGENPIDILNKAILGGWRGIYSLRENPNGQTKKPEPAVRKYQDMTNVR